MLDFDLLHKKGKLSPVELARDINAQQLNLQPAQLAIMGRRAAFLFQSHSLFTFNRDSLKPTNTYIAAGVVSFLQDGGKVALFFEDATKDGQKLKKGRDQIYRTGRGIESYLEHAIKHGIQLSDQGDAEARYIVFMNSIYRELITKFSTISSSDDNLIYAFFENTPRIFLPGDKSYQQSNPHTNPLGIVLNRTIQICAAAVVRDICSTNQIFREVEDHPGTAVFTVRGTNHLGMVTFMRVLSERAYPHLKDLTVDVDTKRVLRVPDEHSQMVLPLLWNRKFWNDVISAYPDILELTKKIRPEMNMNRLLSAVRSVLLSERWVSYLKTTIAQQASGSVPQPEKIVPITLSQEDFG